MLRCSECLGRCRDNEDLHIDYPGRTFYSPESGTIIPLVSFYLPIDNCPVRLDIVNKQSYVSRLKWAFVGQKTRKEAMGLMDEPKGIDVPIMEL